MYAVIFNNMTSEAEDGREYKTVEAVQETTGGWAENYYSYIDLSNYPNGSEVEEGWRYYFNDDEFSAPPVYHYYAVIDELNICRRMVSGITVHNETNYIEVDDGGIDYRGMIYKDNVFMTLDEANYRMLLALTTPATGE